jgi:hypothetical protein
VTVWRPRPARGELPKLFSGSHLDGWHRIVYVAAVRIAVKESAGAMDSLYCLANSISRKSPTATR